MDNTNYNEIVFIHRYVRKIRKEMNWRKRSIGLNSIEANKLDSLNSLKLDSVSFLDYIAKSITSINMYIMIRSKRHKQSAKQFLSNCPELKVLIKKLKIASVYTSIQLHQTQSNINNLTILYRDTDTYVITPHKKRKIADLTDSEAYDWTRFTKEQLYKLKDLFHLYGRFTVHFSHHFDSEFVLILSLSYYSSAESFSTLRCKFGGNPDFFASVVKEFTQHLYELFYNKISGDSLRFYSEDEYRDFSAAIYERVRISPKEVSQYERGEVPLGWTYDYGGKRIIYDTYDDIIVNPSD